MIERYLGELRRALAAAGVSGRDAERVVAEARDHLLELTAQHGEAAAVARFGSAGELARGVAAQLATVRTRRAAYGAFAALVLAGAGYLGSVALIQIGGGWPDIAAGEVVPLGVVASLGTLLFPQVAFVAGCLALLRALRVRDRGPLPAAQLAVIRSRAAVALAAGTLTVASWTIWAVEFRREIGTEWGILSVSAALALPLFAAAVALARSAQPRALTAGTREDVFDDLAPLLRLGPLRGLRLHPWRFATLFAGAIAVLASVTGWLDEGDPVGGLIRGAFEALAVLVCFALLGRRLALRR